MALVSGPSFDGEYKLKNTGSEVIFEVTAGFAQPAAGTWGILAPRKKISSADRKPIEFEKPFSLGKDMDLIGKRLFLTATVTAKNGLKTNIILKFLGGAETREMESFMTAPAKNDVVAYDFEIKFPKPPAPKKTKAKKPKPA